MRTTVSAWISVRLLICRKGREQDACFSCFVASVVYVPSKKNEGGAKMATLGDKVYGQWRFILAPLRTGMGLL
jgi:hypothetical protein